MSQQEQKPAAPAVPPELVTQFADEHQLPPGTFMAMLEAQTADEKATRTDHYKLLEVARKYSLDPLVKQVYLIRTKKGFEVVIPIDGWLQIMHRHPDYLAHEITENWDEFTDPKTGKKDRSLVSATCRLWTRKRENMKLGPYEWTEYMTECYVPPRNGYSGPWQSHPSRMLKHKAASQCVRYELGVYIPTEDEFARAGLLLDEVIRRTEIEQEIGSTTPPDRRAEPAVPIRTVSRVPVAPAPPDLEESQGNPGPSGDPAASTSREVGASSESPAAPASPAPPEPEPFDDEESRRLDIEAAKEAEKPKKGLFEP